MWQRPVGHELMGVCLGLKILIFYGALKFCPWSPWRATTKEITVKKKKLEPFWQRAFGEGGFGWLVFFYSSSSIFVAQLIMS